MIDFTYLLPFLTRCIELASALAFIMFGVRLGFRVILNAEANSMHLVRKGKR